MTLPQRTRPRRRLAGAPALLATALTVPAWAQTAAPAGGASQAAGAQQLDRVMVTGSNMRRTDTETPSPVQIIGAEEIRRSGYTSVADVLHNITANNMGSLSQANPGAFAAGGGGVSLRGLTVGATLVLINGHRMASYPMPDDGERDFVDIASLPMDAIDRIEVLKDGASAVYGSDAIAGVVNVILKKSVVGTTVAAETGFTTRGGGRTQHASVVTGLGDLGADGHNAYLAVEFRHQDPIRIGQRKELARTDWSPYGGNNLTQGTNSGAVDPNLTVIGASSGAGSGTGFLANPNVLDDATGLPKGFYYYPGCTQAAASADQCGYANTQQFIQPETTNLDLLGRYTARLSDVWSANLQGSVLRSDARTVGLYNNGANSGVGSGGGLNLFRFSPGVAPTPAFPDRFPFVLTVPPGYPGNTSGADANLVYDFPDLGPLTQHAQTTSYRLVGEVDGSVADWDINASVGYTRVATKLRFDHYIDFPALQSALDDQSYIVGGSNGSDVISRIAPVAETTSTNTLEFASLRASRDVVPLPGGMMTFGAGAEFTHRDLNELFPASFREGRQASNIYSFAVGKQNIYAGYLEFAAPLFKGFELDAAARADHYDTYGRSVTPKVGLKFTPVRELTLRGTYSRGFRAPNPAEIGQAGSTSGYVGGFNDPVNCPGGTPIPGANPVTSCNIALQELQLARPGLKPERSTSYTAGIILEPARGLNATLDYYHITIRDQIISVGQLGQIGLDNAAALNTQIYRDADGNILYDTYPFINANSTTTSGIDLDVRATLPLGHGWGALTAEAQTTYMLQYDLTAQGTTYALAGTHGPAFVSGDTGTPRARTALTLTWDREPYELSATVNYIGRYGVVDPSEGIPDCATALSSTFSTTPPPDGFCHVPSFTTVNLSGRVMLDKHWQLHASIVNLFNRRAPYDLETFGSAGNGAQQGGAPYNPALHQEGAVGTNITVGARYTF